MKAFLLPLLSATLALAPTIGLAQTSKCDPADDSCKYYQVTYKLSSDGSIFGNLTVNSRRLKGWRWRTPSKIYNSPDVISEFCTLVDTFDDEEWSYVFEDSEGISTNIMNIYTNEINENFYEDVSLTVRGLNRLVNIEFEVSFSECPEGPHHTYYGTQKW